MLTQLATVKSRLALVITDYDGILTNAIRAVSDRFDKETNRTLSRTTATHEFAATDTEILPPCYPVESVTKFELKSNETEGWSEQTGVQHLIRRACVISLSSPLDTRHSTPCLARVTLTESIARFTVHPTFRIRSRALRSARLNAYILCVLFRQKIP